MKPDLCCEQICLHLVFPPLPPYHMEKTTVGSVSFPGALHKQWDQTACTLAAQPQHPNPVSTRMVGPPNLEEELGTLSCARLLLKSTELIFDVLSLKQHHWHWRGW